jgi:aerobic-type carbon monoxide dehydrogenase small subunit (CoxS/CutS family)
MNYMFDVLEEILDVMKVNGTCITLSPSLFCKFTPTNVLTMLLNINGVQHTVEVDPDVELLSVLRNNLDLTGSKYGCGEGVCGACTVLINGTPTRSCITSAGSVVGKEIITIEGLEKDGKLHPVQEVFLKSDPFQCSYCASGMIMSAVSLLKNNPAPSEDAIVKAMNGNICRCGTYPQIAHSIKQASKL